MQRLRVVEAVLDDRAGVEPQQVQSSTSSSSMSRAAQTARVEVAKSQAVDSRLQPG